ncbi:phosphoglucosamine mutase [Miltoncostaea marina]|uniref:phosphoglucosamine mutase n=1 Tax=Miltoncostaea marina TaxID=2843215 RepID=UPI001C3D6DE0|nr:phosphoglucosamine mutase [Miltoncostaea marina]
MPPRRLFGTDGVRGVANRDLTPELALALGRALAARVGAGSRVLIGRDTRRSGPMLEGALAAGLASAGADAVLLGVVPTPAVAELVAGTDAAAGAVISASHNPFPDNGIKLFGADGFKLADADEAAVEGGLDEPGERPEAGELGEVEHWPEGRERYVASLLRRASVDLRGLSIVVDCAHGATVATAPEVLRALGASVTELGVEPDGLNINVGCGSTDLGLLSGEVPRLGADLGLAFDGDGDRVLAVDAAGTPVDGDQILAVCALDMRERGLLAGDAVVTTTMTNLGFRRAMAAEGIEVRWTDVGDRYVLEEMQRGGYVLGGEQSGHLINLAHGPSGDGLAAALHLLRALVGRGDDLGTAAAVVQRLPQKLVNIRVERKSDLPSADGVWEAVRECESVLGDDGRVVVRPSGTEPLVRVMVEAPTAEECERWCASLAEVVERELGGGSVR